MLSGSRNGGGETKRRISTVLASVEEEHSDKNSHSHPHIRNNKTHKHRLENKSSGHSQSTGIDKIKHRKIIVLKDLDPDEENMISKRIDSITNGPITKSSSNAVLQPGQVNGTPIGYRPSNRKSSNKLIFA